MIRLLVTWNLCLLDDAMLEGDDQDVTEWPQTVINQDTTNFYRE
jgi:hypothetical protein